jgi:hypothetical protein
MLVFWPHSVFGQNHLSVKMLLNRDSTIHSLQVRRNSSSLSAVWTIKPSRPDDVSSRLDARQTSIIRPDEVFIPSEPHTVSRSFCTSLLPSGRFSSMSGRLPVLDQFLSKF